MSSSTESPRKGSERPKVERSRSGSRFLQRGRSEHRFHKGRHSSRSLKRSSAAKEEDDSTRTYDSTGENSLFGPLADDDNVVTGNAGHELHDDERFDLSDSLLSSSSSGQASRTNGGCRLHVAKIVSDKISSHPLPVRVTLVDDDYEDEKYPHLVVANEEQPCSLLQSPRTPSASLSKQPSESLFLKERSYLPSAPFAQSPRKSPISLSPSNVSKQQQRRLSSPNASPGFVPPLAASKHRLSLSSKEPSLYCNPYITPGGESKKAAALSSPTTVTSFVTHSEPVTPNAKTESIKRAKSYRQQRIKAKEQEETSHRSASSSEAHNSEPVTPKAKKESIKRVMSYRQQRIKAKEQEETSQMSASCSSLESEEEEQQHQDTSGRSASSSTSHGLLRMGKFLTSQGSNTMKRIGGVMLSGTIITATAAAPHSDRGGTGISLYKTLGNDDYDYDSDSDDGDDHFPIRECTLRQQPKAAETAVHVTTTTTPKNQRDKVTLEDKTMVRHDDKAEIRALPQSQQKNKFQRNSHSDNSGINKTSSSQQQQQQHQHHEGHHHHQQHHHQHEQPKERHARHHHHKDDPNPPSKNANAVGRGGSGAKTTEPISVVQLSLEGQVCQMKM